MKRVVVSPADIRTIRIHVVSTNRFVCGRFGRFLKRISQVPHVSGDAEDTFNTFPKEVGNANKS